MKSYKKKLSWLLIISMILGQASFASLADSDDDDYGEIQLINDLFQNGSSDRNLGRRTFGSGKQITVEEVTWDATETPKVTVLELKGKKSYFANGEPVTIVASASDAATYIVEKNGAYTEVEDNSFIYGGATSSNATAKTDIIMQSGTVDTIVGGNIYEQNLEQVSITIVGGTVKDVFANASTTAGTIGGVNGAASFAERETRSVKNAEIYVGGNAEVTGKVAGTAGYSYTENLEITVADDASVGLYGVTVGTNGENKKAIVNIDGGEVSAVSTGMRTYVGHATFNLNGGRVDEVYAGSYYPKGESTQGSDGWNNWNYGHVDYGKAEKMNINVGESADYGGIYPGFQLMTGEIETFLTKYSGKIPEAISARGYFSGPKAGEVTMSVAAAPTGEPAEEHMLSVAGYGTYKDYVALTLPAIKVVNGTAEVLDAEALALEAGDTLQVLPGTALELMAEAPNADEKFVSWDGSVTFDDSQAEKTTCTVPKGLVERTVTALYEEKTFAAEPAEVELDLYKTEFADVVIKSDYEAPFVKTYDEAIIEVSQDGDDGEGNYHYEIIAVQEGETTIVFGAEGTDRTTTLVVRVVDTTPTLTVVNGKITAVDGTEVTDGESGRYGAGLEITLTAANLEDKIFTGWKVNGSSVTVSADNILVMPDGDITVEAQYKDKAFHFAEGTLKEVNLNVDQTETNTEGTPGTYTFRVESDYADEQIVVGSSNVKFAAVTKNEDGSYTIQAAGAGMATIRAILTKDDGRDIMLSIAVNVADTTKVTESENGKADIQLADAMIQTPDVPEGVDEGQAEELAAELEFAVDEALDSMAINEAAREGVAGFDQISEKALLDAGIPAGSSVVIYPKQELKAVETGFEETKTIDPETQKEVVTYKPIVKRIVFDIKPYAASNIDSGTEKMLSGLRGSFRFRIPVPNTISENAKYAKLTHRSDQSGVVVSNQYLMIQEERGHKFVEVSASQFSLFELEFTESKPSSSRGGGGGGGGSRTTGTTGKWVLDATGWWYQYTDRTYPANGWAYLTYATNENKWYHFNANGYMQVGWFTDTDGRRYYLHPISDGTMGHMYTGWHQIDGKWYYFSETKTATNPVGSLLVNTTTPDGHLVDASGARIQ